MKYDVDIAQDAIEQINDAYQWLMEQTPQHAPIWHSGLVDVINSLEENPERCPLVPEDEDSSGEIRQLLHGN